MGTEDEDDKPTETSAPARVAGPPDGKKAPPPDKQAKKKKK
jgi:hypothetical protein